MTTTSATSSATTAIPSSSTTSNLNTGSLSVDSTGKVIFSGATSGIDTTAAINAIMTAKRVPIDNLNTKITANQSKIAALQTIQTDLNALKSSLSTLYGAITADKSSDIFAAKQTYASSSRSDGGTASAPATLIGVTSDNTADAGTHTLEVIQTAASQKVASKAMTDATSDLGTAAGLAANSISGQITIGSQTIDVLATDSLTDLRDRINNANTGSNATGVTASIVTAGSNQAYLVLSVDQPGRTLGTDVALSDPNGVLQQLGVTDSGGNFTNQLQAARKAQFYADGLIDSTAYTTSAVSSASTALGQAGTLTFTDASGATIGTLNYTAGMSLSDIQSAIAGDSTLSSAGISAAVTTTSSGAKLSITGGASFNIADSGSLASGIGLTHAPLLIERSTNTVSDLFKGITLSLYQSEPGTKISIEIDRDLSKAETAIQNFVTAYNKVRQDLNTQLDTDPATGAARTGSALFGDTTLSAMRSSLSQILGAGSIGTSADFSALAQVGIDFVDNGSLSDPTLANTIKLDSSKLETALLNNFDDVKKLFAVSVSSSDPRFAPVGFTGSTGYSTSGYTVGANYNTGTGALDSATISDGTATASGRTITVNTGGASGLVLYYNGDAASASATVNVTEGVASQMFFALSNILDQTNGSLKAEIDGLTSQNTQAQTRIDETNTRLTIYQNMITEKFTRMEQALSQLSSLKDSITQITDAWYNQKQSG